MPRLQPHFTLLATTLESVPICKYRPVTSMVLDGTRYFCNGWNQPWYADLSAGKLFPLGSRVPTTFAVNDSGSGSTFPIGTTLTYYLVFRNTARQEETAPQIIAHVMGATNSTTITWTDPGDGRWTTADIYRRKQLSNDIVRVASVTIATGTYTDTTADGALSTAQIDAYTPRYRNDLPPKFKAMSAHLGRILGVTGRDSNIYFSQAVLPSGELVQTDFPSGNILAVEPDDGLGVIVTIFSHYDTTIIVKERGCYLLQGDFADTSLQFTRMYQGRGAFSPRSWVPIHAAFVLQDEMGPYGWSPNAEPSVLGSNQGPMPVSPLAPLWRRANRSARDMVHIEHDEERGIARIHLPIDAQPIPMQAGVWNYRDNRFDSIDSGVPALAAGKLEDASGFEHQCYLDELLFLWEREIIVPQGLEAGDCHVFPATGPSTSVTTLGQMGAPSASLSLSSILGPAGTPCERRNLSLAVIDSNRVLENTSVTLTLLYWSSVAALTGTLQTLDVGVVGGDAEFAASDYGTADRKTVARLIVRHTVGDVVLGLSPTLLVSTGMDGQSYTLRRSVDLTKAGGWSLVPCWDRGFRWNLKFDGHRAPDRFEIQAITADLWTTRVRR